MSTEDDKIEEEIKPRSSTPLKITLGVLSFVVVLTILSFTNPEILIGWYIDDDIREQLLTTHNMRVEQILNDVSDGNSTLDNQIINVRFLFDDDQITDIRVSRAIDVFNEVFQDHIHDHKVYEGEDGKILELTWRVDKKD